MSVYTTQTRADSMNTSAPLAITADGRWIASPQREGPEVRRTGPDHRPDRLAAPVVPIDTMMKNGVAIDHVPDGRFLGVTVPTRAPPGRPGHRPGHRRPAGWRVARCGSGGSPLVVAHQDRGLGFLVGGEITPVAGKAWNTAGTT